MTLLESLGTNVSHTGAGCHEWTGPRWRGYGKIWDPRIKKQARAHRVAWSVYRGPIPPGMLVLHKCHNPACINPDHLYIGTAKQNTHDMDVAGRRVTSRQDTFCKRGHPFSEENTLWRVRKDKVQRLCKICSTISNRRAYLKRTK